MNETFILKPPEAATAELFSDAVAPVRIPPELVLTADPDGAESNDRVPSNVPLLPAELWSAITVPVPPHEAGNV